jgi:hypothetical protein
VFVQISVSAASVPVSVSSISRGVCTALALSMLGHGVFSARDTSLKFALLRYMLLLYLTYVGILM